MYRLLARRWQSRLNFLLSQQEQQDDAAHEQDVAAEELSDLLDLAAGAPNNDNLAVRVENRSSLLGLRDVLQQLGDQPDNEGDEDDSDEEPNEEPEAVDMEEDDGVENQDHHDVLLEFFEDDNDSDHEEFASAAEDDLDENGSVMMEDVDTSIAKGQRAVDQPRTVSMSSDDL